MPSSSGPVVIVEYDPAWREMFLRIAERIAGALGPAARRIDHIGSTAVEGLGAKPVIDVQVSVEDVANLAAFGRPLERLGYRHRLHPEAPNREFFRPDGPRTVHVHVVGAGSDDERVHLLHRDFLRSDAAWAAAYDRAKRELADHHGGERQAYQRAKDEFVGRLDVASKAWAVATGWSPGPPSYAPTDGST